MIFILPVGMNYRTDRIPVVTFSLMGVNILVWLVSVVCFFSTSGESEKWISQHLWLIPKESFWWTYLTSMFVHAGFFHLLGNMIYLFLFGCCVEDMIGRVRFAVLYLASGIVAELAYIAFSPGHFNSGIPMGGASGAISACLGMYLLLRASAEIEFKYFYWLFFAFIGAGEFFLPAWIAITFWFLSDLFWMALGIYLDHRGGGTAFGAHVGGFLAGLALAASFKWIARQNESAEASNDDPIIDHIPILATTTQKVVTATETPTIFLHDGTHQTGPFTLAQVQAMLHAGAISRETEYWSEGLDAWQNIAELSGQPGG